MKAMDITQRRSAISERIKAAIAENDAEKFQSAFEEMMQTIADDIRAEYTEQLETAQQERDSAILNARGVRQLTSEEKAYYQKIAEAMKDKNPKQALANLDVVMPETVIDRVFEDLRTEHPLLGHINFMSTTGAIRMLLNTNGYEKAAWGKLCAEIIQELTSGFKEIDVGLFKLSAFLPICKAMLDLGAEWLDRYIREILYEALANGMEEAIVDGTGKDMPIGMTREVGEGVTVTGGVYPRKAAIVVRRFDPETIGNLLSLVAVDENGKARRVTDVILLVNPQDYLQKVMPATTIMAPDGTYRNDVLPYPMDVIQTPALSRGEAVLGLGKRYFAAAGMSSDGRIEYSDEYRFLEDERVYLIKTYANGMPVDNNSFLVLDISALEPALWEVEAIERTEPSGSDAASTLNDLKIGALTLTPTFNTETTEYAATTSNATNTITATPSDADAEIVITVNGNVIDNGSAATWNAGENTVEVEVIGGDGTTTYTVTVTKE